MDVKNYLVGSLLISSLCITVFISYFAVGASVQENTFALTIGGSGEEDGHSVRQTKDGGYIVVGQTDSLGLGQDILVVKTDAFGQIIWQKTYGTTGYDKALFVSETPTGQYYLAGAYDSSGGTWILKLDPSGNVIWQKEYLISERSYMPHSFAQTVDGRLVIAGFVVSNPQSLWVFELQSDGNIAWQKSYVHEVPAFVANPNIQRTADGGFVLAAETMAGPFGTQNGTDLMVLKLNSVGDIIWKKAYGDAMINQNPVVMQQSSDGGYIISSIHNDSFSLVKLNGQGNIVWQKRYGSGSRLNSIQETPDGGFIGFGSVWTNGVPNMVLVKFDGLGAPQWQRRLGRNWGTDFVPRHEGSLQYGRSIQMLGGGGFVVAGKTELFGAGDNSDIILLRLDSQGRIQDCCIEDSSIELEVSPTYFATTDTDVISIDVSFNVVDTNAIVVTPPFTPHYVCCGEAGLNIKQGNTNIPNGSVYDFGFIQLGESRTVTFLIENNNSEQLGVGLVDFIPLVDPAGAFSISTDMYYFFVQPNDVKSFEIEFAPSNGGAFEAEIVFPNSDCDENPYSFSLIGYQPSVMLPVILK